MKQIMKKNLLTVVFVFFSLIATAQVKEIRDIHGIPVRCEFSLGKYVFGGDIVHGCYELNYATYDENEAEMLYNFIRNNKEQINEKYSVNIKTIKLGKAVKFIDFPPYKVNGGMAVAILIETPAHEKYMQAEKAEKEERINSLQNIF